MPVATLISLMPVAACNVLAGMPAGTLSMTAAAEAIETDCSCAFVVGSAALSPLPHGSAPQPSQRLPALLRVCMGAAVR